MIIRLRKKYIDIFLAFFLVALYTILKIYRNSINYASTTQGGIWNVILVILITMGFAYIPFIKMKITPSPIRIAVFYAFVVWFNGLITLGISGIYELYYYIVAPCFALIMLLMFQLTKTGFPERINQFWILCLVVILLLLFYTYVNYFKEYQYWESSGKIALNNSYFIACAIPFFLRKKNKIGILLTIFSVVVVFISNKRAGLIAVMLGLVFYYYINAKLIGSLRKAMKIITLGILTLAILCVLFYFIDNFYDLNVFTRLLKLFKDGGSGRIIIYKYVWNEIRNSNLFQILFGHGVSSITHLSMSLSSAHSDFLNIFYEYGIFALILIIVFYIMLFAKLRQMINLNYENSSSFAFSIIVSLFFSLFSANLDSQSFSIILAVYWGIEMADWNRYYLIKKTLRERT